MNRIVFLGTGSAFSLTRQMTSIVLIYDGRAVMVDCGDGMGTVRNLYKANIPLNSVNDIFFTHKHADHISGISQFMFCKLFKDPDAKVRICGSRENLPAIKRFIFDTHDFVKAREKQIAFVITSPRQELEYYHLMRVKTTKVTENNEIDSPCYAYSFIYKGTTIVYSGDMSPNRAFERLSYGCSIMIHECNGLDKDKDMVHQAGHSTAREAGVAADRSRAKHLILTHLRDESDVASDSLKNEAGRYFPGKITVVQDLMEIPF